MSSSVSSSGSLITIREDPKYMYYSKSNTSLQEIYEIVDRQTEVVQDGSYAMSASIENVLIDFDLLGIKIISPSSVRDYLYCFSDMAELLRYVVDLVRTQFDSNIQLSLEIYHDTETSDEYLTLYVRQNQYDSDIMKKIKQIRKKYRGLTEGMAGRFLLTTDFRSPR